MTADLRAVPDKQGRVGAAKGGRKPGTKSSRTPRQRKLAEVLNKMDPLLALALEKAEAILKEDLRDSKVSPTVQLQAVKLIVDKAIELRNECYKDDTPNANATELSEGDGETQGVLSLSIVES